MKKALIIKNGKLITDNAEIADTFFSRFRGLMLRKSVEADYALHIIPCNQIHTFSMRFPIDVVYLSNDGTVIEIHENIRPNKICKTVKKAESVIELNASMSSKLGIFKGDVLEIRARVRDS